MTDNTCFSGRDSTSINGHTVPLASQFARSGPVLRPYSAKIGASFVAPAHLHFTCSTLSVRSPSWSHLASRPCADSLFRSPSCTIPSQTHNFRTFFNSSEKPSKKFRQRRLMGWSAEQFYHVVADVEQYHEFVPWCQKSRLLGKPVPVPASTARTAGTISSAAGACRHMVLRVDAELEVGFQLLVERYISRVSLEPSRRVHSEVSNSLLFHHLDSTWGFEPGPTPASCWLTFDVDFAFNSAMYTNLADVFFSQVVQQMVGAFEGRCTELYGHSSLTRGIDCHDH
ncbi:hypothetical protein CEUSTIGMA_g9390.t1 [Chlamydomonas eustigma]|uniref:Coenzyme Q-binding protein COQ10 START domain-containing protein n=1 Tax=Chlamydomonas eustigma TaxID=1157962 RepID=A0A250XGB7_9CHLO|nr:hypothetical protein CEUSTIGMA_g9390.t1 [Chlamydomonas eustigma]|eukprot:GAX81962.1 hypothetical protein CEUSTIGMA_g9390.t1 [Chlamydomonas eustigma]